MAVVSNLPAPQNVSCPDEVLAVRSLLSFLFLVTIKIILILNGLGIKAFKAYLV